MKEYRIPAFNKNTGYLKPGVYCMTIEELINHSVLAAHPSDKN